MSQNRQLLLIIKKNEKLKTFLMLKVIEIKYNIGLNKLLGIKTRIGMIVLDLIIF